MRWRPVLCLPNSRISAIRQNVRQKATHRTVFVATDKDYKEDIRPCYNDPSGKTRGHEPWPE